MLLNRSRAKLFPLLFTVACVALSLACYAGRDALLVSGGNPPSFQIIRSSTSHVKIFPIFIVSELHPDNEKVGPLQEDDSKNKIVWRLAVDPGQADLSEKLEMIEYGKVPAGYHQEMPAAGAPEQLRENQMYEANGALSLMSNTIIRFTIVNGKVTSHPVP